MKQALFINGIYETVLNEIIKVQKKDKDIICYLQPYKNQVIKLLEKEQPSATKPTKLYISTTTNLNLIEYTAEIINWEDKRKLYDDNNRLNFLNNHIKEYQPNEVDIYEFSDEKKTKQCVNLLSIINLKRITNPFSVSNLIKMSDNTPYKPRTQSGGWSAVHEVSNLIEIKDSGFSEKIEFDLETSITVSKERSSENRKKRLEKSNKIPTEIQIISKGFKRNADVIVEVLQRANGVCEKCNQDAPFIRKKDSTLYLEVHHKILLADGGEDSIENAIAVCPNCHRELHFGCSSSNKT